MKKDTLMEIILGTVGGVIFAIGMCMCLIAEWNMFKAGIVVSIIGAIALLLIIPVYKAAHPRERKPINMGILVTWVIGIVGALLLGFGMSKIMTQGDYTIGLIAGVIGLLICVLNYPIYAYIKDNK